MPLWKLYPIYVDSLVMALVGYEGAWNILHRTHIRVVHVVGEPQPLISITMDGIRSFKIFPNLEGRGGGGWNEFFNLGIAFEITLKNWYAHNIFIIFLQLMVINCY